MRNLTRDPQNNPWAELKACRDLLDRVEACLTQWAAAEAAYTDAAVNPLSTTTDLRRYAVRVGETRESLHRLLTHIRGQAMAEATYLNLPAARSEGK